MLANKLETTFMALKMSYDHFKVLKKDVAYFDWHKRFREKLGRFHDVHVGEDLFIIGNGPSLNKMDLNLLNDYHTFGLNKINLIFEKFPLQLSYHASVDTQVLPQIEEQLKNNIFNCSSFTTYQASENMQFNEDQVYRLFATRKWSFYHNIMEPIHEGYTVTYVAMQVAYYMGFKRIFLIGVDHNFKQSGKANEVQVLDKEDENHFHPDYFKGMKWNLADLEGNEASYALAKHQFHAQGREILDATVDGKLNVFTKIPYEKAIEIAKTKKNKPVKYF